MHLTVNTPSGSVLETSITELTAPGVLGEFGILTGHIPILSAVRPGVMTYFVGDKKTFLAVGVGSFK